MLSQLRTLFALGKNDPWPQGIQVIEQYVSDDLVGPLDPGVLNPGDVFNRKRPEGFLKAWDSQMKRARFSRIEQWRTDVWSGLSVDPSAHRLLLIESPRLGKKVPSSQSPKGAHREAALLGWRAASQVLHPMIPEVDDENRILEQNDATSLARVKNAVADLVLRQTGTLYDLPAPIYHIQAGLPESIATNLTVIGLYRKVANRTIHRPGVNYPMAVRMLPDGQIEACLPGRAGHKREWRPYQEVVTMELGTLFARRRELELSPEALLTFTRDIVLEEAGNPTLVLAIADDWRTRIWPQLRNDVLRHPNRLDMNHPKITTLPSIPIITPEVRPHLRVIRLRERGTLVETPQYVASIERPTWTTLNEVKEVRSACGFIDTDASGPFFHYLSLGRQPKTAKNQGTGTETFKHEEGGVTAFKHQTPLEIVPIFLQKQDIAVEWARVPHFLRESPAWDGGGLLSPYPIHLAQAAFEDMMCLIGEEE